MYLYLLSTSGGRAAMMAGISETDLARPLKIPYRFWAFRDCSVPDVFLASYCRMVRARRVVRQARFFYLKDGLTCTGMPFLHTVLLSVLRTITACSSQCSTCVGATEFCLTCNGGQLASGGKCVTSCPSNTISTSGTCTAYPDCATCSGTSFNQYSSCPPSRPVLSNGRCVPACSKTEFFDKTSGSCQACDSSCSSCS
jgi:hypothetical protein